MQGSRGSVSKGGRRREGGGRGRKEERGEEGEEERRRQVTKRNGREERVGGSIDRGKKRSTEMQQVRMGANNKTCTTS